MAPVWTPHIRLTFGGIIGTTTPESWSNTIRFYSLNFEPTAAQLQAACDAVEAPLKTWFQSANANISNVAKLNTIKLNWVMANGKQRDQQTVLRDVVPAAAGANLSASVPWYQTQALTFRTRLKRGRAHSGRIFPPLTTASITNGTPYISVSDANNMATAAATMLRGCRTAIGGTWAGAGGPIPDAAVFSPGDGAGKAPLWTPIISVVVDRVPDVQHRRTKSVPRLEGNASLLDP